MNNKMYAAVVAAKEIVLTEMRRNYSNTDILEYFPSMVRYYSHQSIKLGQALCLVMFCANWMEAYNHIEYMTPSTEDCALNAQFSKQLLKKGFDVYVESEENGSMRLLSQIRF